jgi:Tol biopolymer transport system component
MKLKVLRTTLAALALAASLIAQDAAREQKLQQAIDLLETKGDAAKAIPLLEEVARSGDDALAARGLLYLGQAQERQGLAAARNTYERIVRQYAAQHAIAIQAQARLTAIRTATEPASTRAGGPPASRRQVERPEDVAEWGTASPDGNWLSFTDAKSGNLGIFDLRSRSLKLLTDACCDFWAQGYTETSVWSPDGRQLAFAWRHGDADIKIVSRDGGPARTLFDGPARRIQDTGPTDVTWAHPFAWSPDGKSILAGFGAFVSAGVVGRTRLVLVSTSDGTVRTLKDLGRSFPRNAIFSPDGRFIVYDYPPAADDIRDVFIMAADGSGHRRLVEDAVSHDQVLVWLDATRVVYTSDRMGTRDAWLLELENGRPAKAPVLVKRSVGDNIRSLGVSNDGALVAEVFMQLSDVLTVRIDEKTGRAAGQPVPLTRAQTGMSRFQATWSPDGSRIAYFQAPRSSGRAPSLAVQDFHSGGVRSYPLGIQNPERPVWRPDGRAIVFNAAAPDDAGGEHLFLVDLETGAVSTIAPGIQAAFPKDSKFLYYPVAGAVVRRDLSKGEDVQIHPGPGAGRALVMSPDDRWLATFHRGAIIAVSTEGEPPHELLAPN